MIRFCVILLLAAALVGVAFWEQSYIDNTFKKMENETATLIQMILDVPEEGELYKSPATVKHKIDHLHRFWIKKERKMCIVMRHMELSYISDALIYARNFVHFDNKEESCAGLERLNYLITAYSQVYGTNAINIF